MSTELDEWFAKAADVLTDWRASADSMRSHYDSHDYRDDREITWEVTYQLAMQIADWGVQARAVIEVFEAAGLIPIPPRDHRPSLLRRWFCWLLHPCPQRDSALRHPIVWQQVRRYRKRMYREISRVHATLRLPGSGP